MGLIKNIWEEYQKSDEADPILDQAMSSLVAHTKLSEDDIIDVAEKFIKSKLSFSSADFALTKTAAFPSVQDILKMQPADVAKLVATVMQSGNSSERRLLTKAVYDIAEEQANGNVKATSIAKVLKDRHMWAGFENFFERWVSPVLAGSAPAGRMIGSALSKEDFFYYLQEYQKGKGYGLPWYSLITLLTKFIFIVVRRLFKVGMILGLLGTAGYGIYRAYKALHSDEPAPNSDSTTEQPKPTNDKKEPAESLVKSVDRQLKELYGDK